MDDPGLAVGHTARGRGVYDQSLVIAAVELRQRQPECGADNQCGSKVSVRCEPARRV
jgi:hypothetical protein